MQAYSINNACPVFSMRDQVATALAATLGHVWDLIEMVPQPEERLEMIYVWVEDWDKIWNYHTKVEQRRVHINNIFEDYQERVELRAQLEVERLTREPSMCTHSQAATTTGKGKGKEKVTDEVDELENNEGNHPPNPDPSKAGAPAPEVNLRCRECMKVNAVCKGLPGESCKQCRQAKWKCSQSLRVGRKCKNTGSGGTAAGLSHKWTKSVMVMMMTETPVMTGLKLQIPAHKPPPRQNSELTPVHPTPRASPPLLSDMPPPPWTFWQPTGLLDDPPAPVISTQDESEGPPVEETPQITNPSESTTHETLAECIQLLEGRADDEEFELTQIHQMLGLLVTRVEQQISAVQGRCEELKRLKDQLKDM
ncbi:hypothetical protein F5J12DRAFT_787159 [Pisolithus orientalis]|uniref:uncharacterized protein n=1 Tax=Pisolithus orientalis TaxID=936130 RepID=UPI00222538E3|nr:uncharacterized protein F5J12DRAFT_787159 [Pisolithus orientalis]KAI5986966.1 hypothetical protein F5J12DRAFT_787159 [Pisolithus orientalis]